MSTQKTQILNGNIWTRDHLVLYYIRDWEFIQYVKIIWVFSFLSLFLIPYIIVLNNILNTIIWHLLYASTVLGILYKFT